MSVPVIMNMIPAILVINVLSILFSISIPRKIVIMSYPKLCKVNRDKRN